MNGFTKNQILRLPLLIAICMVGCDGAGIDNTSSLPQEQTSFLNITVADISTRTTVPENGTEQERSADILYIYFFSAADGHLLRIDTYTPTGVFPYTVSVPPEIIHAGEVDVQVFASPGIIMPENPTRDELTTLRIPGMTEQNGIGETFLNYITATRHLPMTSAEVRCNFAKPNTVHIPLTRSVAKLRIRIADRISPAANVTLHRDEMSMQLRHLRIGTPFLPLAADGHTPADIPVFNSQRFETGTAHPLVPQTLPGPPEVLWEHTAYVNEHIFNAAPGATLPDNRISLHLNLPLTTGTVKETVNRYELPLDFPVIRNHIYQLTVNLYGPGTGPEEIEARLTWEISSWEVIETDVIQ